MTNFSLYEWVQQDGVREWMVYAPVVVVGVTMGLLVCAAFLVLGDDDDK